MYDSTPPSSPFNGPTGSLYSPTGTSPTWQPPAGPTPVPESRPPAKGRLSRTSSIVLALVAVAGGTAGGAVAGRASAPEAVITVATPDVQLASIDSPVATSPVDISTLVERVRPSVVRIDAITSAGSGTGTGFVISADGRIATNAHVIGDAATVEVEFSDGAMATATVLGSAKSEDLAVIQVDRSDLTPVEFGLSDDLKVGERVVAIGNSLGFEGSATATEGIVSALGRSIRTNDGNRLTDLIQTDAAINPGNSGGPLFDLDGKVVGINSAGSLQAQNVGFAIAADSARPIFDTLSSGEPVLQAFLGISSVTLTPQTAAQLGIEETGDLRGAVVLDVTVGSAADVAGLRVGDVITAIDGDTVETPENVGDAIAGRDPGDTIRLAVVRDGFESSVDAVLGSRQA
ncbi:trypsin-like peptidase domain-containing protein [uncultured Ilumatobacter sp.]|uniref:S1C family serine protease n=1 Tax=uncultured Ilumatobacter sp. TaxID=879968 RepID=UPI00374E2858